VLVFLPLLFSVLAFALLVAATNWLIDPAGIYRGRRKPSRNLRLRKLALLKGLRRQPCGTLVLGSSRVFNLMLADDIRFPQPPLNFAVTTAKAEDYLAGYLLVSEVAKPTLVVIGIEHPAFHPTLAPQWEAFTAGRYTDMLEGIGALKRAAGWRWRMLLSALQFHQALIVVQRGWRERKGARQKFRWSADGSGTWLDLLEGRRNPRLLRRQLRNFPRTGLAIRSYRRIGEQRLRWFAQLLELCAADGARVIAYVVPAQPQLVARTWELGFEPIHEQLIAALAGLSAQHGAVFNDWYDGAQLGLDAAHFRDVLHLTDEGQALIRERLAQMI
jgi:hypothetical protein